MNFEVTDMEKYNRMHIALEANTKNYRLSPAQFVWLRRGSKW